MQPQIRRERRGLPAELSGDKPMQRRETFIARYNSWWHTVCTEPLLGAGWRIAIFWLLFYVVWRIIALLGIPPATALGAELAIILFLPSYFAIEHWLCFKKHRRPTRPFLWVLIPAVLNSFLPLGGALVWTIICLANVPHSPKSSPILPNHPVQPESPAS